MALRQRSKKAPVLQTNINVTPFVDVMLVLLIVFMVSMPMMQTGVQVNMPQGQSGQAVDGDAPVVISLDKDGQIFLRDDKMDPTALIEMLKTLPQAATQQIYIRADKDLRYEDVMRLMQMLSASGFVKVNLVVEKAP